MEAEKIGAFCKNSKRTEDKLKTLCAGAGDQRSPVQISLLVCVELFLGLLAFGGTSRCVSVTRMEGRKAGM